MFGSRLKPWDTKPIARARIAARAARARGRRARAERRARGQRAVDDHVTRRGTVQPAEHVHERGLPAAALADDRDVVAGLHAERHAVERAHFGGRARRVDFHDVAHVDDPLAHQRSSATVGGNRAALSAGMKPATALNATETANAPSPTNGEIANCWRLPPAALRASIAVTTASPRAMPAMPPSAPIVAASPTNVSRMEPSVAPIALRIPISRVRSVTAIVIVLITENAPTSSAMSAAPNTIASKIPSVERTVLATSRGSRADKPSISAMRRASNPVSVPFFDATMNADTGSGGSDCRNAGTTWRSRSCASA